MRKEVLDWLNSAGDDLKTARTLLENMVFYASAFYSQQAAEKALKAVHIHKLKKISTLHNIVEISREVGAPQEIVDSCRRLNPHYVQSRYPDAANAIPADVYDKKIADDLIEKSGKVLAWCENQAKE